MTRLLTTLRNDLRIQWRNGFYAATAFVTLFWLLILSQLQQFDFVPLLPSLLIGNLAISTFYFVAALVLLEKDEGSYAALQVTPLRLNEYLLSKVVSLTLPALLETITLAALLGGRQINWWLLVLSTLLACGIYVLVGFALAQRYRAINEFLLPSGLLVALLWLPLMARMAGIVLPWYLPHPLNPAFWLANAAIVQQSWGRALLAVGAGIVMVIICVLGARWMSESVTIGGGE